MVCFLVVVVVVVVVVFVVVVVIVKAAPHEGIESKSVDASRTPQNQSLQSFALN